MTDTTFQDAAQKDQCARTGGAIYLAVILIPLIALVTLEPRFAAHDPSGALAAIAENAGAYRINLAFEALMYVLVLMLAPMLYFLVRDQNRRLATLALVFRGAEGLVGLMGVLVCAAIVLIAESGVAGPEAVLAQQVLQGVRGVGMDITLILLGLGAIPFMSLLGAARIVPMALALFGMACYAAIAIGAFVELLVPAAGSWLVFAFAPGSLFEIAIGLWLLVFGTRFAARGKKALA